MSSAGSLTILLVLEMTLEYQVSAFSIGKMQEPPLFATDLDEAESSVLAVKHDLQGKDVTVIRIDNKALSQKIVPIETTAKTEEIKKNNENTTTEVDIQETTDTSTLTNSEIKTEHISSVSDASLRTTRRVSTTTQLTSTETDTLSESTSFSSDSTTNQNNDKNQKHDTINGNDTTTDEDNTTSYSIEPVVTDKSTNIHTFDTSSSHDIEDNSQSAKTPNARPASSPDTSEIELDNSYTTTNTATQDTTFTETLAGDSSGTAAPYWKKYTLIERKRPTTPVEESTGITTENEVMVRAHTAQGILTLEKAFTFTSDIPSLEKLKNELLSLTTRLQTTPDPSTSNLPEETFTGVDLSTINAAEIVTTISSDTTNPNSETTKLDNVLTSQRAGFLNFSFKPTESSESTTIDNMISTVKQIEPLKTTFEILDGRRLGKKLSSMTSQSQLAEDAINEELLKEEMLNDNLEYTKQYREERFDLKNMNSGINGENMITTMSYQPNGEIAPEVTIDDTLSVKPINTDKQKNTSLYTVSPNYKPLKKIEIQPSKSFVRDPDDNSWRNESLSSLGIVFKAKNSSKPFTQVLKNKTEIEWNASLDKNNKDEEPELRERLEKIAEIRKTKKKKTDKFGEIVYDYEESNNSAEFLTVPKTELPVLTVTLQELVTKSTPVTLPFVQPVEETTTVKSIDLQKTEELNPVTTQAPKKSFNVESYEGSEEEDADYVSISHIDLKKFITSARNTELPITTTTPPLRHFIPDRQPTVQYFPPRVAQKVNVNDYDNDFQRKVNAFTIKDTTKKAVPITYPPYDVEKVTYHQYNRQTTSRPTDTREHKPIPFNNNYNVPVNQPNIGYAVANQDGTFNRASYVIKHLRDYISEAAKDSDEDRNTGYIITELPVRGITTEFIKDNKVKSDYYDYEAQFRKQVLDRFVENFNQNSERFKVDFPILYNTSVVHNQLAENGKAQASSSAFIKRLYDAPKTGKFSNYNGAHYDPNCERTVELSPEYELHYYVPEQEEREEAELKPATLPHRYRLRV